MDVRLVNDMKVYTSRQLIPRYVVIHNFRLDGMKTSSDNLIGVFDNVESACYTIENFIPDLEEKLKELDYDVIKVSTNNTSYWCVDAQNKEFLRREMHHFEIKSYDEGYLYLSDGIGLL